MPTGEDNFESYYKKHFDETDHEVKLLYFYMLQMDMLLIENKTMTYCLNEYDSNTHGYTKLSFLGGLSATSVIPSEIIEITAGMGSFETNRTWKVEIDGFAVPISELGVGLYKFKAELKVGTHTKMVKIFYTDEYGNNRFVAGK